MLIAAMIKRRRYPFLLLWIWLRATLSHIHEHKDWAWYRSSNVKAENTKYIKSPSGSNDDTYNPIQRVDGSTMWYRFYEVESDTPFFSGRLHTDNPPGTGKQYDLMRVEPERRYGYEWGEAYGQKLLKYAESVGY